MIGLFDLATAWWQWTAAMSVQVVWLVAVVAILDRALAGRTWPQLRMALWAIVVVKLVLPPTLTSPVSVALFAPEMALGPEMALRPDQALGEPSSAVLLGFSIWIAGFALFAALAVARYLRLRREWLGRPAEPSPAWFDLLVGRVVARLGLVRTPVVRVQRGVVGPAVVGFLRPVVVVPADLVERATRAQLEHVLLHELAHVKRRDPLASLVCLGVQLAYWFHPCAWLARSRLSTLREICCDQTVARALRGQTEDYRRTLLQLARPLIEARAPGPGGLMLIHRQSQLLVRLESLARPLALRAGARRLTTAALSAIVLLCCVPVAPLERATTTQDMPALEDLEGCMQLRFAVLRALAAERAELVAR